MKKLIRIVGDYTSETIEAKALSQFILWVSEKYPQYDWECSSPKCKTLGNKFAPLEKYSGVADVIFYCGPPSSFNHLSGNSVNILIYDSPHYDLPLLEKYEIGKFDSWYCWSRPMFDERELTRRPVCAGNVEFPSYVFDESKPFSVEENTYKYYMIGNASKTYSLLTTLEAFHTLYPYGGDGHDFMACLDLDTQIEELMHTFSTVKHSLGITEEQYMHYEILHLNDFQNFANRMRAHRTGDAYVSGRSGLCVDVDLYAAAACGNALIVPMGEPFICTSYDKVQQMSASPNSTWLRHGGPAYVNAMKNGGVSIDEMHARYTENANSLTSIIERLL